MTPTTMGGSAVTTIATTNGRMTGMKDVVIDCHLKQVFYGQFLAVRDSDVPIEKGKITGFIGPSG